MSLGATICQTCRCDQTSCMGCLVAPECESAATCCCPPAHQSWRRQRIGRGIKVEYFSTAWMLVEVIGSLGVGLLARSVALMAFGGDSLIEILSGVAVLTQLRRGSADRPTNDVDRVRTERVIGALLFALIPVIGLGAVYSYLTGLRPEGSPLGVVIAIGAVVVMPYLFLEKRRIGKETRTLALSIDALESLTCLFMSIALLGGLLVEYLFGFWWVDYVSTAVILLFVAKEAMESFRELREAGRTTVASYGR